MAEDVGPGPGGAMGRGEVVETAGGRVRGATGDSGFRFLGLPYATAARFAAPQPVAPWTGERRADAFGPACPQLPRIDPAAPGAARAARALGLLGIEPDQPHQGEDCLVLNVWTPGPTSEVGRPVLVWLHGFLASGSGAARWSDGAALARLHDVVVVTVNSRLSVLGHLAAPDDPDVVHNAGILDIVAALRWVRTNIAGFGGDPGNVTLGGISAGALRAACVASSPLAAGLVHRLALHSPLAVAPPALDEARERGERLLAEMGLRAAAELRSAPMARLLEATRGRIFLPVVDGVTVTTDPLAAIADGHVRDLPLVAGTTQDEAFTFVPAQPEQGAWTDDLIRARLVQELGAGAGTLFTDHRERMDGATPREVALAVVGDALFGRALDRLAEGRAACAGAAPAHVYRFAAVTGFLDRTPRAPHGFDVPFLFQNLDAVSLARGAPANRTLAVTMGRMWASFLRGEEPHVDELTWPAHDTVDRARLVIGPLTTEVAAAPAPTQRTTTGALTFTIPTLLG